MSGAVVNLIKGGTHRCLEGHPWIYASEIAGVEGDPSKPCGAEVRDAAGRLIGGGLWSAESQIRVRLFSLRETVFTKDLLRERMSRAGAAPSRAGRACGRLVWSEADGLPGLVVDRYDDTIVVQILHAGMEMWRGEILAAVRDIFSPAVLLDRSNAPVRLAEGLPLRVSVEAGAYASPRVHKVGNALFEINLLTGHKTGAYLDQADNYALVSAHASGRKVLDCFSNTGGFAVHCAIAGAASVDAVESSSAAVSEGKKNAALNQVGVVWHEANAFDWLRQAHTQKRRYDLVVLDPPSFTKTRDRVREAVRGYREIHVRALHLLKPGGLLATYCCSHHVTPPIFEEMLRESAGDAHKQLRLVARHSQSIDHPVLINMPESEYLKGWLLEVV